MVYLLFLQVKVKYTDLSKLYIQGPLILGIHFYVLYTMSIRTVFYSFSISISHSMTWFRVISIYLVCHGYTGDSVKDETMVSMQAKLQSPSVSAVKAICHFFALLSQNVIGQWATSLMPTEACRVILFPWFTAVLGGGQEVHILHTLSIHRPALAKCQDTAQTGYI